MPFRGDVAREANLLEYLGGINWSMKDEASEDESLTLIRFLPTAREGMLKQGTRCIVQGGGKKAGKSGKRERPFF